jgi:hypothetical protein
MPKRKTMAPARPAPIQLPLFAETASLVRVRPALNEWRYYRMEIWPDLFGRALLVRQWGRPLMLQKNRSFVEAYSGSATPASMAWFVVVDDA